MWKWSKFGTCKCITPLFFQKVFGNFRVLFSQLIQFLILDFPQKSVSLIHTQKRVYVMYIKDTYFDVYLIKLHKSTFLSILKFSLYMMFVLEFIRRSWKLSKYLHIILEKFLATLKLIRWILKKYLYTGMLFSLFFNYKTVLSAGTFFHRLPAPAPLKKAWLPWSCFYKFLLLAHLQFQKITYRQKPGFKRTVSN